MIMTTMLYDMSSTKPPCFPRELPICTQVVYKATAQVLEKKRNSLQRPLLSTLPAELRAPPSSTKMTIEKQTSTACNRHSKSGIDGQMYDSRVRPENYWKCHQCRFVNLYYTSRCSRCSHGYCVLCPRA